MVSSSRRRTLWLLLSGVAFMLACLGVANAARLADYNLAGPSFWIFALAAVAACVGAIMLSVAWMRLIDEAAREAHKSAWFWGGNCGMAVVVVGVIFASVPQAGALPVPNFLGRDDPLAYMASGAMATILIMVLGYTIAWAWWWLSRR